MQGKHWLIVVVSMLVLSACDWKQLNDFSCPDGKNCHPDAREGEQCGDIKCKAPTPVCDTSSTSCVECVESGDCADSRPVCSPQHQCLQCLTHDDCMDSKLCLVDNTCAVPGEVTYVGGPNASTTSTTCSIDAPCKDLVQAMGALRRYTKVTGFVVHDGETALMDKRTTIYGDQGVLASNAAGGSRVLYFKGTSDVTLIDLEVVGNVGMNGKEAVDIDMASSVTMTRVNVHGHGQAGVGLAATAKLVMIDSQVHDNQLEGVKAASGTTLEVRHSWIYKNQGMAGVLGANAAMVTIDSSVITRNNGMNGGVSIIGPLSIKNSIISGNGDAGSVVGGLLLSSSNAIFDFNTVSNNLSSVNPGVGLSCTIPLNVSNSILTGNLANGCTVSYSLADTVLTGSMNKGGAPMFLNTDVTNPLGQMFYRIGATSPARNSANSTSTPPVDVDIDGQKRDDGMKDMGADEYK